MKFCFIKTGALFAQKLARGVCNSLYRGFTYIIGKGKMKGNEVDAF